jgi:hypothetical protein
MFHLSFSIRKKLFQSITPAVLLQLTQQPGLVENSLAMPGDCKYFREYRLERQKLE